MTADNRQQRRKLIRERRKVGQRALATGLSVRPSRDDVLGVAEVLRTKLLEVGNDGRAGEAAALAQSLNDRSLASYPAQSEIACGKGCSYCCFGFVAVHPAEAFRLAGAVRAGTASIEAIRAAGRALQGLTPDERVGRKLPCPLLEDGACSVYAERPLVCRQATSLSLPACIEEFEGIDRDGRIEISPVHLAHSSNAHVALLGAIASVGLPIVAYELGSLLNVVLAEPDCERHWLAGDDVFRDLPRNVQRQRDVDLVASRIASALNA